MNRIASTFRYLPTSISNRLFSTVRLSSQLFISRLSFYTTNEELERLFSPFGNVTEARLVMDPRTQRPKGFGFVTFESESEAEKAMKALNGTIVNGRLIFVELANKPKTDGEDAGP